MEAKHTQPGTTAVGRAVRLERLYSNFFFRIIFFLIWLWGATSILLVPVHYFVMSLGNNLGLALVFIAIFLLYLSQRSFFIRLKSGIKTDLSKIDENNFFEALDFPAALALYDLSAKSGPSEISVTDLATALFQASDMGFLVIRLGFGPEEFMTVIQADEAKGMASKVIKESVQIALDNAHTSIWSGDILISLCENLPMMKNLLSDYQLEARDVRTLVTWQGEIKARLDQSKGFFDPQHLRLTGGIGKDWAFGYTNYLNNFSIDVTQSLKDYGLGLQIIGKGKEIKEIESTLLKTANANVLVVGDAGVGKRTTILGFAKNVIDGKVDKTLAYDHIFEIDVKAVISGEGVDETQIAERFEHLMEEAAHAGNVIILFDNIDNLFRHSGAGTADVSEILMPYLENESIHIIGTCEVGAFNEVIAPNVGLLAHFSRVSIGEPKGPDLIKILENSTPMIEYKTGSIVTFEALKAVSSAADKYILNQPNPEKSISLLEGVVTQATTERGKTIILPKDIDSYISEKYEVPSGQAGADEGDKLLHLEEIMHTEIIGQDEAVTAIANAMRRSRTQVGNSKKPIGSFLFLGPTGVGKTATAKALAGAYFGSPDNMIRFDMTEYQNKPDLYRLIGEGDTPGNLTTFVAEKPFSLLLLDEIEKASPDILNIFLQIFDEGFLTNGQNQKVSFSNTIIIATSNAGSDLIREAIEAGEDYEKIRTKLADKIIEEKIFRPEFLNRFTGVIAFTPLSNEEIRAVAKLMIENLAKTILENRGITLTVADDALDLLAQEGYDPAMGARPMARVLEEKIENLIAEKLLKNELKKGDKFEVTKELVS